VACTTGGVEVTVTEMNLPVAHSTLVQLLRRNAVVIQVVFALLWSLRFVSAAGAPVVAVGVLIAVAIAGALAIRIATRAAGGMRARDAFRTPEGRRFMRPVTWLTVAQIAGSIVVPGIAGAMGHDEWVMPLVATTIGLFLIGFGRPLQLRTVSRIGAAATLATLALPLVAMGPALIALTATSMIAALLASAWCCAVAARLHTAFTLGQRG
jgi:hypothetical protein